MALLDILVERAGALVSKDALIEAACATGAHLWANRFDSTLDDVFELQDNVASSVAGVIEPRLEAAEYRRSIQRPTTEGDRQRPAAQATRASCAH